MSLTFNRLAPIALVYKHLLLGVAVFRIKLDLLRYASLMKKLVIFGLEDFADIAFEYFSHDSDYEVVAFTAHAKYIKSEYRFGIPILPYEKINTLIDPKKHFFFAAVTYRELNSLRERIASHALSLGFTLASYVSSHSFVWRNAKLGDHCFVFENNTIQPFSEIGNNTILWSGNHIGHHSRIGKNVFISSQVVVSGWVIIGDNCFLGVNATFANGITVGKNCWVNSHTLVTSDIPDQQFVVQPESARKPLDMQRLEEKLREKSSNR